MFALIAPLVFKALQIPIDARLSVFADPNVPIEKLQTDESLTGVAVTETPGFWIAIAKDPRFSVPQRRIAFVELVRRHFEKGTGVEHLAKLLSGLPASSFEMREVTEVGGVLLVAFHNYQSRLFRLDFLATEDSTWTILEFSIPCSRVTEGQVILQFTKPSKGLPVGVVIDWGIMEARPGKAYYVTRPGEPLSRRY